MANAAKDCRNNMSLRLCHDMNMYSDYCGQITAWRAPGDSPARSQPTSSCVARAQDSSKEPVVLPIPALRVERLCLYTRAQGSPKPLDNPRRPSAPQTDLWLDGQVYLKP